MVETLGSILVFLIVLTVLVVIHEAGHLIVAKTFGIKVLEFGIGFPPRVFGLRYGETLYSINAIPFGGFVKMVGEEDPSEPRSLAQKSPGIRLLVMAAGPIMNTVLAIILFTIIATIPQDIAIGEIEVQEVYHSSPAWRAGIQPGDIIIQANDRVLDNHRDIIYVLDLTEKDELTLLIQRHDERLEVNFDRDLTDAKEHHIVNILAGNVVVELVQPNSPADIAGIQPKDIILEVNGEIIDNHSHLIYLTNMHRGSEIAWLIKRDNQKFHINVTPRLNPPPNQGAIGVGLSTINKRVESRTDPDWAVPRMGVSELTTAGITVATINYNFERRSLSVWNAIPNGLNSTLDVILLMKNVVNKWLSGGPQPFSGPVGIGQLFVEVGQLEGISAVDRIVLTLRISAIISTLLGVFNFLPIPALDGGRMLFVAIEIARKGKRISPQKEGFVHMIGFMILITMMLFITFAVDIQRIIQGQSVLGN